MAYGDYNYSAPTDYMGRPQADPLLRTAIKARNYSERMAPSQLGPYGSLGGSGGRAAGLAALAQREAAKPQNVFTEQGGFSRPGMTFEQKMDEVRRNIALAGGYTRQKNAEILMQNRHRMYEGEPSFQGGMNDTMVPDIDLTPTERRTMWHTPEVMAERNANRAAQQERMRRNSELRKQLFADRVRNMHGRAQGPGPAEIAQQQVDQSIARPSGWARPEEGATPDMREESIDSFVRNQNFNANPDLVANELRNNYSDQEIRGLLNRNSGLFTENTLFSTIGDWLWPGQSDEITDQTRFRDFARRALGQQGVIPQGTTAPVGRAPVNNPAPVQYRPGVWPRIRGLYNSVSGL